jgi:pyruvate/2-oxoglutarate dehydrogenase complex dihydrolipoamide acyltransferase (E2) component
MRSKVTPLLQSIPARSAADRRRRLDVMAGPPFTSASTSKLRLTCDHRILNGADAAGFLRRIKELLEQPPAMSL